MEELWMTTELKPVSTRRRRKRHTPEQIIAKLREADAMLGSGATIGQVCQRLEISEPTFSRWRQQYGGMKASEAKRLKELEQENARLKKLVADLSLDNAMLKDVAEGKF
jgi:putative transposase